MAITRDPAAALQVHLEPNHVMRSGSHGNGVSLQCGCGLRFDAEHLDTYTPDGGGAEVRGWDMARRLHAEHVSEISRDLFAPAPEDRGPVEDTETRKVPSLESETFGNPTGAALAEFAREHGLSPDWHEPDNMGVGARLTGTHLDNAMGSRAGRLVNPNGTEFGEFNVVLTVESTNGSTRDAGVVNLATLLATAARAV